jgi:hypothetical protein
MLQDFVITKYIQTLKKRYERDNMIDPVFMDDIDTSKEWLMGDEDSEGQAQHDLVFDDDDFSWLDVEIAIGAAEPIINTRSQAAFQKAAAPPPNFHLHLDLGQKQKEW